MDSKMEFYFFQQFVRCKKGRPAANLGKRAASIEKGDTTVLTNSNIALSLALVLCTVSAGMAASKHPVHHSRTHVVASTRGNAAFGSSAYGYATPFRVRVPNSLEGTGEGTIAN
jgi:hypothetical protein